MKVNIIGISKQQPNLYPGYQNWTVARNYASKVQFDRYYDLHARMHAGRVDSSKYFTESNLSTDKIFAISKLGLTSTISWLIAQAITENATAIKLTHINLKSPSHAHLAPGVSYWLGIALSRGIQISGNQNFVGTKLYGL